MFTVKSEDGQNVPVSSIPHYSVRVMRMQLDIEVLAPSGKLMGVTPSSVELVCEVDFFPGLVEFLKRQGITLADPTPVEVAPIS